MDEPLEEPDFELEPLLAAGAGPGVAEPEDEAEPLVAVALPELELEKEPITRSKVNNGVHTRSVASLTALSTVERQRGLLIGGRALGLQAFFCSILESRVGADARIHAENAWVSG